MKNLNSFKAIVRAIEYEAKGMWKRLNQEVSYTGKQGDGMMIKGSAML